MTTLTWQGTCRQAQNDKSKHDKSMMCPSKVQLQERILRKPTVVASSEQQIARNECSTPSNQWHLMHQTSNENSYIHLIHHIFISNSSYSQGLPLL
jgi:hypothetical protein